MRLSLLARKLSVKPSVIIEELLIDGEKPLHGNSKLSEDQIEEIVRLFGPLPEEIEEPEPIEQSPNDGLIEESKPEVTESIDVTTEEEEDSVATEVDTTEESISEEISSDDFITPDEIEAQATQQEAEDTIASEVVAESNPDTESEEEPIEAADLEIPAGEETAETEVTEVIETIEATTNGHTSELEGDTTDPTEKREVLVSDLLEDPDEDLLENSDVLIKAPKVHLPGLTVKGKIDLPEPKPKPEKEATGKEEESEDQRGRRGRHRGKRRKQTNPVAAARMREERQAERRKKAQQAQEKERKRQHYQKNIQSKAAPPPKKKVMKKADGVESNYTKAAPEKNLNALQRFWKWMNT